MLDSSLNRLHKKVKQNGFLRTVAAVGESESKMSSASGMASPESFDLKCRWFFRSGVSLVCWMSEGSGREEYKFV